MGFQDSLSSKKARRALVIVNGAGALAAASFAAIGVRRPSYIEDQSSSTSLSEFWAASSAVRTWAVSLPLLGQLALNDRSAPHLLRVAGLVQLGDSALGIRQRNLRMTVAPAAMGLIHLASACIVSN